MDARTVSPFCVREKEFTPEEVVELLENLSGDVEDVLEDTSAIQSKVISVPPCHPKAGEVYIFKPDSSRNTNDWKADQYRWYQNGTKLLPSSMPVVKKVYAVNVDDTGKNFNFKRLSYTLLDKSSSLTLIHYTGDHTTATQFPHGNSKLKGSKQYVRSCPSVLQKANEIQDVPSNVYKKMVAEVDCANFHQPVLLPRDTTQIRNLQARNRQRFRLTHDSLYNLHELAYDLDGFVSKITTYPNLIVVCGLKGIKEELDRLILTAPDDSVLMSYDTTFQLGDFYLSPFLFKHVLFKSNPVVPAAFLLHERKFKYVHKELMLQLKEEIPSLATISSPVPIVVDDETALNTAIDETLTGVHRVRCWNHTINAVKLWLRRHGAVSDEIPVYVSNLRDLFHQPSEEAYENKLTELKMKWSDTFSEYYYNSIHPEVTKSIGRWILERLGIYNPYSGITTNQSEGFNTVLKYLQHWKEAPVDAIVLSLYHLQSFYYNEINRGFSGLGNFSLKDRYAALTRPCDEVLTNPVHSPEEIVKRIREKIASSDQTCQKNDVDSPSFDGATPQETEELCALSDAEQELDATQRARARAIVNSGNISHNEKLGVFTVLGTTGNPNVIRLFPKESCSCPSTRRCYHIMAVRMSVGLDVAGDKKKINLTELRRNSRSRRDKTSGRKRPRLEDCDIVAAPDSLLSTSGTSQPTHCKSTNSLMKPSSPPLELSSSPMRSPPMKSNPSMGSSPVKSPSSPMRSPPIKSSPSMESPSVKSPSLPLRSPPIRSGPSMESPPVKSPSSPMRLSPIKSSPSMESPPVKSPSSPMRYPPMKSSPSIGSPAIKSSSLPTRSLPINPKPKKRLRKKVRFDSHPGDNDKQSESTEMPNNFNKLYSAIRLGEKLDDGHISAASKILSKKFPDIQGLHTPVLGQNLSFPMVNSMYLLAGYEYIQILHTGADHWITVCVPVVSSDEVKVYDSMFHSTTYTTKKQIASILRTRSPYVKLQIGMTQFQENSLDCGVYAIAFATDLCHGNDPVQLKYDSAFNYIC